MIVWIILLFSKKKKGKKGNHPSSSWSLNSVEKRREKKGWKNVCQGWGREELQVVVVEVSESNRGTRLTPKENNVVRFLSREIKRSEMSLLTHQIRDQHLFIERSPRVR